MGITVWIGVSSSRNGETESTSKINFIILFRTSASLFHNYFKLVNKIKVRILKLGLS